MPQDRLLELSERTPRLDPQLVDECVPAVSVRRERLGLPARAVERQHQLLSRPLPQRMVGDEGLELTDELAVPPGGEVCVDPLLEAAQVELFQSGDLALGEVRIGELGQGRPAPELERLARHPVPHEPLELQHVELVVLDPDQVAGRLGEQAVAIKHLPQLRDVDVECLLRRLRRLLVPERLRQALGRDDLVRMQEQHCQEGTVLRSRQGDDSCPVDHVERAEDPELHCWATVPPAIQAILQRASALPNPVLTRP